MSIKSIFYCYFHPDKGPQLLYQVPEGSVLVPSSDDHTPSPTARNPPLFAFDTVSHYLIPKQTLCDRLVSLTTNSYRILSYPICLEDAKYDRNEFIFNFAIVLEEEDEFVVYKPVVRKLARLFRALEEQSGFLWNEVTRAQVEGLIEQVLEDLNFCSECMIPINESNTINLKLFPVHPPPPPTKPWLVPLPTVSFASIMDVNWDLTMQKIIPYIDGLNSIARVAECADADYSLTAKCISELLYYHCLLLVDVFRFANVYCVATGIGELVREEGMGEECAAYVLNASIDENAGGEKLTIPKILELYGKFRHGITVKSWALDNARYLKDVDIRRFVQYGVIKGFLVRIYKYPVLESGVGGMRGKDERTYPLLKWLDGTHHLDQICTELRLSEADLLEQLGGYGEVLFIHR